MLLRNIKARRSLLRSFQIGVILLVAVKKDKINVTWSFLSNKGLKSEKIDVDLEKLGPDKGHH